MSRIWPGLRILAGGIPLATFFVAGTVFQQVFVGEFDPGSGRTLAACLTHASGATNRASARGRAANG